MEAKTIAVAILGGAFDHNELGDNDIACIPGALEELQEKHVTGSEDVQLDLIERSHFDRVTAERDALQLRLNAVEEENDRLREGWYKDESDNNRFWPEELHDAKDEIYGFNALLQDLLDYDISIRARQRIEEALSISKVDKTTEALERRP